MTKKSLEEKLFETGQMVSLHEAEKAQHREALRAYMQRTARPVVSPYAWLVAPQMRMAFAALLLFIAGGTGAAFAAEGSRPGDVLYPIKVRVTEPTRVAFTFDPKEKAALEVSLTDRRLTELASAAVDGTLTEESTDLIVNSLNEHLASAQEHIDELHTAYGATSDAVAINTDLESALTAHVAILDSAPIQDEATDARVETLSDSLSNELEDVSAAGDALGAAVTTTEDSLPEAVNEEQAQTQSDIETIRTQLADDIASIEVEDKTLLSKELEEVDALMRSAGEYEANGNLKSALLSINEAALKVQELKKLMAAEQNLGVEVISEESVGE